MSASLSDIQVDQVSLIVLDSNDMIRFYTEKLGMVLLQSRGPSHVLGFGPSSPALELVEDPLAMRRPGNAPGLFHTAFLYPSRAALASALHRLASSGWPLQGAADHGVSEALYLADPEGNGIELYVDRPKEAWPYLNGALQMVTEALDLEDLLAQAGMATRSGSPVRIGHVHLQVSSLHDAEAFWCDAIGLQVTQRSYPGALFVSAGGYHHHLGLNTWRSRGMNLPEGRWTGLRGIKVLVPNPREFTALGSRLTGGSEIAGATVSRAFESTDIHIYTMSTQQ